MGVIRFRAQLQRRGLSVAVVLDEAQVAAVGEGAKRFPVVATVNGYTWRTSVARMGGEFLVGLNREARDGAGVQADDEAEVTIELDRAPREVEVPEALAAALAADPRAGAAFERMAFTHRKECARWIAEAKRAETRQRRVAQAVQMIQEGNPLLTALSCWPGCCFTGPLPTRRAVRRSAGDHRAAGRNGQAVTVAQGVPAAPDPVVRVTVPTIGP